MRMTGNTILITGGATGIGYALAKRLLHLGNEVIICGRRKDALQHASTQTPGLHTYVCDVSTSEEREQLIQKISADFPKLNVLINNAGIQQRLDMTQPQEWNVVHQELMINLEAPIHLCNLLVPHLRKQQHAAILNVTSGLSFSPLASVPVYCATKAALHSYTRSLRHQLAKAGIEVIEIIPPAVDTDLGGPGLHTFGVKLDEFADHAMGRLAAGDRQIAYGFALEASKATPEQLEQIFQRMNEK